MQELDSSRRQMEPPIAPRHLQFAFRKGSSPAHLRIKGGRQPAQ